MISFLILCYSEKNLLLRKLGINETYHASYYSFESFFVYSVVHTSDSSFSHEFSLHFDFEYYDIKQKSLFDIRKQPNNL